jgi:hypothetical protein
MLDKSFKAFWQSQFVPRIHDQLPRTPRPSKPPTISMASLLGVRWLPTTVQGRQGWDNAQGSRSCALVQGRGRETSDLEPGDCRSAVCGHLARGIVMINCVGPVIGLALVVVQPGEISTDGAAQSESATKQLPWDAVEWRLADGGNGHFYQVVAVDGGVNWPEANKRALAAGGHLVTITSEAENAFVFRLMDHRRYWIRVWSDTCLGPWTGALQAEGAEEPDGGWQWVTGEEFAYSNWQGTNPADSGESNENRICFMAVTPRVRSPEWNDEEHDDERVMSYVVEFDRFGEWEAPRGEKTWEYQSMTLGDNEELFLRVKKAEAKDWELVCFCRCEEPQTQSWALFLRHAEKHASSDAHSGYVALQANGESIMSQILENADQAGWELVSAHPVSAPDEDRWYRTMDDFGIGMFWHQRPLQTPEKKQPSWTAFPRRSIR